MMVDVNGARGCRDATNSWAQAASPEKFSGQQTISGKQILGKSHIPPFVFAPVKPVRRCGLFRTKDSWPRRKFQGILCTENAPVTRRKGPGELSLVCAKVTCHFGKINIVLLELK
ncbi:hypothetical protein KM043_010026 [Ampulex compressa]|nr:hypothetical protein KM043_010026 [Ampulex compressa]